MRAPTDQRHAERYTVPGLTEVGSTGIRIDRRIDLPDTGQRVQDDRVPSQCLHESLIDDETATRCSVFFGIAEALALDARLVENVELWSDRLEIARFLDLEAS